MLFNVGLGINIVLFLCFIWFLLMIFMIGLSGFIIYGFFFLLEFCGMIFGGNGILDVFYGNGWMFNGSFVGGMGFIGFMIRGLLFRFNFGKWDKLVMFVNNLFRFLGNGIMLFNVGFFGILFISIFGGVVGCGLKDLGVKLMGSLIFIIFFFLIMLGVGLLIILIGGGRVCWFWLLIILILNGGLMLLRFIGIFIIGVVGCSFIFCSFGVFSILLVISVLGFFDMGILRLVGFLFFLMNGGFIIIKLVMIFLFCFFVFGFWMMGFWIVKGILLCIVLMICLLFIFWGIFFVLFLFFNIYLLIFCNYSLYLFILGFFEGMNVEGGKIFVGKNIFVCGCIIELGMCGIFFFVLYDNFLGYFLYFLEYGNFGLNIFFIFFFFKYIGLLV